MAAPGLASVGITLGMAKGFLGGDARLSSDALLSEPLAGVSTDSRTIAQGELFVALEGPNFDGNLYAGKALSKGAMAALVSRERRARLLAEGVPEERLIFVGDTLGALGALARGVRLVLGAKVAAITGSVAKTTVKELAALILRTWLGDDRVLWTQGNLNNEVGLPLTLLSAQSSHTHAVLELGANDFGEIGRLAGIARPDVALITKVAPAHLMNFKDLEGVARAKGELFRALDRGALAVVNLSDPLIAREAESFRGNVVSFGREADGASYHARAQTTGNGTANGTKNGKAKGPKRGGPESQEVLAPNPIEILGPGLPEGGLKVALPLPGAQGRENALAAAALAMAMGADPISVKAGLEKASPPPGRGRIIRDPSKGVFLLDESYNANPESMRSALGLARSLGLGSLHVILGPMLELGDQTEEEHRRLGLELANIPAETVALVGEHSGIVMEAALSGGLPRERAKRFDDPLEALAFAMGRAKRGDLLLVKGSHSAGLAGIAREFQRNIDAV
jgi:UDP-N-acetylmuramoyl-tripeptide--D-alanyl-D-alanine ligase